MFACTGTVPPVVHKRHSPQRYRGGGKAIWGVVTWAGSRKVCEVGGLQHDEMEVFWFVPSQCDMWMLALCRWLLTSSTVRTMMVGED